MEFITLADLLRWGTPLVVTLLATVALSWFLSHVVARQNSNRLYRQLAQVVLFVVALMVLVLALPFDAQTRAQLLSLFGVVITAVIALSSTTFVSNAMAGLTLKAIGSFHTGDFIRVGDHFGRVTTKALLNTEIQSEDRDTITLPNLFVITNLVQVVDQSGTLISAEASIGYDVHRHRVRACLLHAAEESGLSEPFVQITSIGSFAIHYKVTGFLDDVTKLVSKKTELMGKVIDALHSEAIEVMTPNVMSQRPMPASEATLPATPAPTGAADADEASGKAEKMMFDKAELAARIAEFRAQSKALTETITNLEADNSADNEREVSWRKRQLQALNNLLESMEQDDG